MATRRRHVRTLGGDHRRPTRRWALMLAVVGVTSLVGAVVVTGAAAAAPSDWAIVPSPNNSAYYDQLNDVSCTGASSCMAVGDTDTGTLAETWDGTSWSVTPSPSEGPVGLYVNDLEGVSCSGPSSCMAVGYYQTSGTQEQPLVESWDGTSWSIVPSPNPGSTNYELHGVSCSATTNCVAVGSYWNGSQQQALVEDWDGSAWSFAQQVNRYTMGQLQAVTCLSSGACWAVGTVGNQTLVEFSPGPGWQWVVVSSPSPGGSTNELNSVSCAASNSCVAVGTDSTGSTQEALAESWDGTSWTVTSAVSPDSGHNELNGVSCAGPNSCLAVGDDGTGPAQETLAETWDGTSWTVTSAVSPGGGGDQLDAVSCDGASCTVTGQSVVGGGIQVLTESWDGTSWSLVASPSPAGPDVGNVLNGVSCGGPTSCIAVGYDDGGIQQQTLVEAWDGASWTILPSPSPGTGFGSAANTLNGVSCTGPSTCVAVGADLAGETDETLVEAWDGASWTVVPSPSPASRTNILNGVSCTGPANCVAVGVAQDASSWATLVESWDGTSWSVVPSPSPGEGNELYGVSCTGPDGCMAVGATEQSGNWYTLVESWNGSAWTVVPSPSPGSPAGGNALEGVSCTGPSSCMAVGEYANGSTGATLTESWNGAAWSVVPSPGDGRLFGVSCTSTNSCVAVGGEQAAPIEYWNGTTWSALYSPPGTFAQTLKGVTCATASSCTAVGYLADGNQTLIETSSSGALGVVTTSLPAGSLGQPYASTIWAEGGNPPYHWKLVSGAGKLPKGLTLDPATGAISGTPTKTGTFDFTVRVKDSRAATRPRAPSTATEQLSITIS